MAKDQGTEPAKARRKPGRVPTSCAECRRLKLRCDKNVPCEKCVSRGCGSICPDGSLTTGKGNRLVLANTEQLHDRIEHLCSRIRELETALKNLQATVSLEPHPLLRSDLLQVRAAPPPALDHNGNGATNGTGHGRADDSSSTPSSSSASGSSPTVTPHATDEALIDAFGTLTLGANGESSFLGKTARSEYLIRVLAKPESESNFNLPRVSKRVIQSFCPESELLEPDIAHEVFSLLPPLSEAVRLCEIYLDTGRYLYSPVPRQEVFDEILTPIYRAESYHTMAPECNQKLALLFSIFALATLFDPEKHPYCVEAQEYYYLSKAAFGFSSVNQTSTLHAVQAMVHFCQYQEFADWESLGSNVVWTTMGVAVRVGQSIGLHLNSERWKVCQDFADRRGRVFWTLYSCDAWQSFQFGRPPMMSSQYFDCPLPPDADEVTLGDGRRESGFHHWIWQYTTLLHTVMSTAFGSKTPSSYNVVLELDKKIRDFHVPHALQACGPTDDQSAVHYMRRWFVLMYKETVLLHLHRAYFAQALKDAPEDLTRHRYLPSVMSTYRSAWRMIQGLRMVRMNAEQLSSRVGLVWSHALSGAIAMCILVTRAPSSKMTKPSLAELDTVAELFEQAAPTCRPAGNMLTTILSLRKKAHDAVDALEGSSGVFGSGSDSGSGSEGVVDDAELDRLGGKTHLMITTPSTPPLGTATTVAAVVDTPPNFPVGYVVLQNGTGRVPAPRNGHGHAQANGNGHVPSNGHTTSHAPPAQTQTQTVVSNGTQQHLHPTISADMRVMEDMPFTQFDLTPNLFDISTAGMDMGMGMGADVEGMMGMGMQMQMDGMDVFGMDQDSPLSNSSGQSSHHQSQNQSVNHGMTDAHSSGMNGATVDELFGSVGMGGGFGYLNGTPGVNGAGSPGGGGGGSPPMLDATWQSFVEQLGF